MLKICYQTVITASDKVEYARKDTPVGMLWCAVCCDPYRGGLAYGPVAVLMRVTRLAPETRARNLRTEQWTHARPWVCLAVNHADAERALRSSPR